MAQSDILEVGFIVTVNGVQTATVLHAEQTTSLPAGDGAEDLADAILASTIPTTWAARSSEDAVLHCLKTQVIKPTRGLASIRVVATAGTVSSDALPATLGAQHRWQAPPWGKRQKGWHIWSGVPDSHQKRNRLLTLGMNLETPFANSFEDPVTAEGDYEFGVYSRTNETIQALGFAEAKIILKAIRNRRAVPCI